MSARPPEARGARRPESARNRKILFLCSIGVAVGLGGMIVTAQQDDGTAAVTDQSGQRTYAVADFDKISAVAAPDVVVSVGQGFSVRGAGGARALDRFEIVVDGAELKIQPKHSAWWGLPWSHVRPATFYVTLPQISAASFVGSGEMKIDRVEGPRFAATVAGSGHMDIAALAVDDADFSLAGSGDLSVRGRARSAHVSVAGSGDMKGADLTSDSADVSMVGSGDASLTVNGQADVSIVGSGDVTVGGSGHCKISRLGSGDVNCPT